MIRSIASLALLAIAIEGLPGTAAFRGGASLQAHQTDTAAQFALKDGDRVLFYGDSITEQRLYTTYVEHYSTTHYPDRHITFINTGWGGDKVTSNDCQPCAGVGGLARIKRDVLDHRPTVVTLLFGMNDGQYKDFDPAVMQVYEDGLRALIAEIKSKTNARLYVMTPTVYDGTRHTPWSRTDKYNDVLDRYSEAAKQIAAAEGLPIIDLHGATMDALNKARQQSATYTFLPDGVHPAEDGQLVMAAAILRAWGAPAKGYEASKNAPAGGNTSFSISVTAPLPWPNPQPSEALAKVCPEITLEGNVNLHLSGLAKSRYSVTVDGKDAGQFSADELASGIAIGRLSPQAVTASDQLAQLIRKRADIYFFRWRQIEVPYSKDYKTTGPATASIDSLIEEMRDRSRGLGAFHKYELVVTPVG
jgi:lysophospholipase L1-like esterase